MTDKQQEISRHYPQSKHASGHRMLPREKDNRNGKDEKGSKWPLIITGVLLGSLVAAYFLFPGLKQEVDTGWQVLTSGDKQRISDWVGQFGFWGPFFIMLAMVAQMFLVVINVVALMLVSIIAYGAFWGSVIAIVAVVIASTIGYWIGHGVGEAGVRKLIGGKTERRVNKFMETYGLWAIVIARISPFLSNDAVSFVAGLARMNYFKFLGATLGGIVPLTILLAWLGENNERLETGLIWLSAVSIAGLIGYVVYDKYIRKK